MTPSEKVRENRLRRMARRQGYTLTKTRRIDQRAIDYGTYRLLSAKGNTPSRLLTLDEVEKRLSASHS